MSQSDGTTAPPPSRALSLTTLPGGIAVRAVHRTTGQVLSRTVTHPYTLLGRAQQIGVRLDDPSVSQWHAYLQLIDGVPYCIDLGSRTGVLWDDGGRGRGWVPSGQTVRIGMFDVQIVGTGDTGELEWTEPPDSDELPAFEVHAPTGQSGRFNLDLPVTLVGRHPVCNLRFLDEAVAYFQCAIVRTRTGVWCVDILSRTGTSLNGRVTRIAQLRDGDLIEIGKISLLLRNGPPTESTLAVFGPSAVRSVAPVASNLQSEMAPFREMLEQFQQCFATMARMFTAMQQEHTAMMCEQMRQIQELLRETRGSLPFAAPVTDGSAPAAAAATTPPPKMPTPKPVSPEEAKLLADAHTWFLDRLNQNGSANASNPKPN